MSSNNSQAFLISILKDLHFSNACPNHKTTIIGNLCSRCPLFTYHNPYNKKETLYLIYKQFYWCPTSKDYNLITHNEFHSNKTLYLKNHNIQNINDILHLIDEYHVFK